MIFTKPIQKNIMRVVSSKDDTVKEPSFMIETLPAYDGECDITAEHTDNETVFFCNDAVLFVQKDHKTAMEAKEIYRYTFAGGKPEIETIRTVDGERSFVKNAETVKVGDANLAKVVFGIDEEESIYGLGQHENGVYNYRNTKEYLYHNNMKIPMPVYLSSKHYAVLFDCNSMMVYEEKDNEITMTMDAVDQIDYYIITGDCFDELIAGIRTLTGEPVMLPEWAFGYVQSKERYKTQDEILETVARFKEEEIPLGCIVLDWLSWEDGKWGNMYFDKSRFPDAKALVDKLHEQGVAFMISIWPNRKEGCENHTEFAKAGKLLCNNSTYDAFDPEAREMYWEMLKRELYACGADAWWCDSSEPFTPDWNGLVKRPDEERYEMALKSTNQYLDARTSNAYPLVHAQGVYENQRGYDDSKRITNLTRSGYPGISKYGAILWSGDIKATWEVYRQQIAEGLSMGMSGIPYWTLDIGGFFVGSDESFRRWANNPEGTAPWFWQGLFEEGVKDLGYRELYTRWLQMGTFMPVMRSHGTDTPREPWQFGEKGTKYYDTIVKYIKLRYAMMPYTYSLAYQVLGGSTMMRSLMFDFAYDEKVKNIADQFMYGPAFMACPVVEAMEYGPDSTPIEKELTRKVYLPEGAIWYDYETKEAFDGGQTITADAPIEKMPLYVRSGAIVPMSAEGKTIPDVIEVYAGCDSNFVLSFDNGKDYAYEDGQFAQIPLIWREEEQVFGMMEVVGDYEFEPMQLKIRVYDAEGGISETEVEYTGSYLTVEVE